MEEEEEEVEEGVEEGVRWSTDGSRKEEMLCKTFATTWESILFFVFFTMSTVN